MSTIILSCLVVDENPSNAFPVEIGNNKLVGFLKEVIKEKKKNDFATFDADKLKLWKVDIPTENENEKLTAVQNINVNIKDDLGGEELKPLSKISKHFPTEPPEEHIHIIVRRPDEKKEVHCTATYGSKKPVNFLWIVTRQTVSIKSFKDKLRRSFAFPDGTEDEHITISRVTGGNVQRKISERRKAKSEKTASNSQSKTIKDEKVEGATERKVMQFYTDEDLMSIIWNSSPQKDNMNQVDLEIVVDTSQKPFSSYTFQKMKDLFGLTANNLGELPSIEIESSKTTKPIKKIMEGVINVLLQIHRTTPNIVIYPNEANRRPFIEAIIRGVADTYDGKVMVWSEYEVCGSHGKGPIDWVIKMDDTIICVTEAKKEDLSYGVGQSTVQAHASIQFNTRKRKRDEAELGESEMFCIVSTGVDWLITKVRNSNGNGNDNSDGMLELFLCSSNYKALPINDKSLTRDDLIKPVEDLFQRIKGALDQQINSNKRIKVE
ncbi:hypothetical protein Glove_149g87 [Diversispora epigaea]|uniref:Crinkler effector protein N-terminal domain-containing protein n=1 Tax=Diversispora epigaea TaxID=1348612 RepID=A0A397IXF6_9GLOM|nr:hypothetical protein Glove_149g87 [Diversispora epigaea]